jgi:hypothetical protein
MPLPIQVQYVLTLHEITETVDLGQEVVETVQSFSQEPVGLPLVGSAELTLEETVLVATPLTLEIKLVETVEPLIQLSVLPITQ